MLSLRIGSWRADSLGYGKVGDLEVAHLYSSTGGGLQYVKFRLALPRNYDHPALRQGQLVEVMRGPVSLGTAVLAEPDREAWTFVADGLFRQAEHFNAENALGESSTNPRTVVQQANVRGMGWNGFGNLPNESLSLEAETRSSLNTVAAVLNAYCERNHMRWGLHADGTPYVTSDPDEVSWALRPGTPPIPTVDDDYCTRVVVRYVSEVDGTPPEPTQWGIVSATSPVAPHGPREVYEDISDEGLLAAVDAQAYADAFIVANGARQHYGASVEVGRGGLLTTVGSSNIDPWLAPLEVLGQRGRHHGVLEADGTTREWVCGSTVYRPGDRSLTIAPTDLAARTPATVIARFDTYRLRKAAGLLDDK